MFIPNSSFEVLTNTRPEDISIPAFMVSTTRGFLPRMEPVTTLPPEFDAVEDLLQAMPVRTRAGEPGLLATGQLGDTVLQELADLTEHVEKYRDDLPLMNALYRDYAFLASAFLLEPCHMRFIKGEPYGLGRSFLPAQLARPISTCAELCGFKPFMEYAGSYALFNYRLADPAAGLDYANLRLIRAFEHGLDPASSEAGFVLVHVEMVKNSGPLIAGAMRCLAALAALAADDGGASASAKAKAKAKAKAEQRRRRRRGEFNDGLADMVATMRRVNGVMEGMWARSKPRAYTSFRTFIFGITSQSMFPDGVVYEGVRSDDGDDDDQDDKPREFRGESGANDSMVPLLDNFLQIAMPDTPLTAILNDFREYRPSNHRRFLQEVRRAADDLALKDFALALSPDRDDEEDNDNDEANMRALVRESRRLWLALLDQVRDFRWRHWCFAREYILKQTSHPTATGGSPVVTWLPNQLRAVLDEQVDIYHAVTEGHVDDDLGEQWCRDMMERVERQRGALSREVDRWCRERGVVGGQ
ncbi:indoleamine 2,3-dioxygenase family protein [Xylariaceae sp. FL0804]|nr:indoleamine 2,3-dioxygenase family protein [Xylariaceae sp. FL0804]